MSDGLRIAFFGSSLVSSKWNGSCTYYRGLIRGLADRGHRMSFLEPDAFERQRHRDIDDPDWCRVVVYEATEAAARAAIASAADADVLVKCSGVGVLDDLLAEAILEAPGDAVRVFCDVDAPATLSELEVSGGETVALGRLLPGFDLVITYGGGDPVVDRYLAQGARRCVPVYNALDPRTHFPVEADPALAADLTFLGNRLPDREARVRAFLFDAAARLPRRRFLLGGSGWDPGEVPGNVRILGHVGTDAHNALNSSARAVLNVSRESMARNGFSPATRVFEAAGAGACLITDAWEGIEAFLAPGEEVLVARDGAEVAALLQDLSPGRATRIGAAARARVLAEHTYAGRAEQLEGLLAAALAGARA